MPTVTKRRARLPKLPAEPRQQLIDAGCKGEILDWFRARWQFLSPTLYATRQKDDLDRFKSEIDNLAGRLERIAVDAEQLGTRELQQGFTWQQALTFDLANKPGAAPPPDFFSLASGDSFSY